VTAQTTARKRPELLLGAAALLIAAGALLFMGARGNTAQAPTAAALTTVFLRGANPFEAAETAQPPTDAAATTTAATMLTLPDEQPGSYVVGYTSVAVYVQQTEKATGPAAAQGGPVNLNTATQAQLETLPGIGPAKALAILEWRAVNGRFSEPAQLLEISGIGEKTLITLLPFVAV